MGTAKSGFSDSNEPSNSSSIYCTPTNNTHETLSSLEPNPCLILTQQRQNQASSSSSPSLERLSDNLESIFQSQQFDFFSDAKIVMSDGREVCVHRCVLSARSGFFRSAFVGKERGVNLEMKELAKEFDVGYDAVVAVLGYLYSGKMKDLVKGKEGVCCVDEECFHVACRPAVDFLVEILYAAFTFQISELVACYQKHLLGILDKVAIDDVLVILSVANMCGSECERLSARCIEIVVRSDVDVVTLEKALPQHSVKQIMDSRSELGLNRSECNSVPDKHVKRIHRALDSDDVELVRMLLKEGHTTLDDACALHYAVAYCDVKTTVELLDLGIADVNHRNSRGYTVLHVAATRKEPKIIVSLLIKGARPSDLTPDGRKALHIAKRLTRDVKDHGSTEEGKAAPKDRLSVEILEQAERRDPLLGEAALSLAIAGDDLRKKLLYLENRVGLAKLLFPIEAKVAMDIAQVEGTSEFPLLSVKSVAGTQGADVDLNEAPFKIQEEHLNRMKALSRTVELGKRFFPRCSAVIDKIMDRDEISQLVGNGTPEGQLLKRQKQMELKEALDKAYTEDKEEFDKSSLFSSMSSTSTVMMKPNGNLNLNDQ